MIRSSALKLHAWKLNHEVSICRISTSQVLCEMFINHHLQTIALLLLIASCGGLRIGEGVVSGEVNYGDSEFRIRRKQHTTMVGFNEAK